MTGTLPPSERSKERISVRRRDIRRNEVRLKARDKRHGRAQGFWGRCYRNLFAINGAYEGLSNGGLREQSSVEISNQIDARCEKFGKNRC